MSRDLKVYLEDILEAIDRIEEYTAEITFDQFREDRMRMDAVIRNLQVIGQAARQIPDSARKQYQNVEWAKIVGLRNFVVHEYFNVNPEILWSAIQTRLAELRDTVQTMLNQDGEFDDMVE